MIELLVVISIIGLLLSIGAAVALKMSTEARKEQVRSMMEGLLGANDEYKAVRKGPSISVNASSTLSSTQQYVAACKQIKTCEEIMMNALSSSTSDALDRIYKNNTVYDRWGTELEYRVSNDGTGTGPANEKGETVANNLLPISRDPFFASAGPDKEWGTDDDIDTTQQ